MFYVGDRVKAVGGWSLGSLGTIIDKDKAHDHYHMGRCSDANRYAIQWDCCKDYNHDLDFHHVHSSEIERIEYEYQPSQEGDKEDDI